MARSSTSVVVTDTAFVPRKSIHTPEKTSVSISKKMKFQWSLTVFVSVLVGNEAFSTRLSHRHPSTSQLAVLPPIDFDVFTQHSQILADAAETANGPWQSYLKLFKDTLSFVHSSIAGPATSVGITQTWGLSIAIFTTSE